MQSTERYIYEKFISQFLYLIKVVKQRSTSYMEKRRRTK